MGISSLKLSIYVRLILCAIHVVPALNLFKTRGKRRNNRTFGKFVKDQFLQVSNCKHAMKNLYTMQIKLYLAFNSSMEKNMVAEPHPYSKFPTHTQSTIQTKDKIFIKKQKHFTHLQPPLLNSRRKP
ncbi:hypothetical protein L2E82_40273 [Cichorium intybus]|uniref:Uncharacterized protein n=1 Tax=Cichorium intybus TaxID=13427 RepID=A0ACB9ALH8_CICIN|nr:hypothetical protein L2E82_40273 [Cichorium intybus]